MENTKKYQSINQSINQSVRHYRVPGSVEKGAALNLLLKKISNSPDAKPRTIHFHPWLRWASTAAAAAAVILAVIIFTGRETLTNPGQRAQAWRLSDDSRIILASGSSLSYNRHFRKRQVRLDGEAYFEVTPGNAFRVITPSGTVQVLGTRFDAIYEAGTFEVYCYAGSVRVTAREGEQVLQSGEGAVATPAGLQAKYPVYVDYPALALFRAAYNQQTLSAIFQDLESFFGVSISGQSAGNRLYTGAFETGNLENALILICEPLGLEYTLGANHTITIK